MLKNQSLALLMVGSSMGMGMALELSQMSGEVRKKFQVTSNFTLPSNSCSMKYALKLVPG